MAGNGVGRAGNKIILKLKFMNRVIHFEIQADDAERAKDFYMKTFGWKIEKWEFKGKEALKDEKGGIMNYWLIMTGKEGVPGIDGGMYMRPADDKIYTYDCTISVDDINKAIEDVKKNGGKIRIEKGEIEGVGIFAGCIDTEGNRFGLMQPKIPIK